jgi:vacuolar protein sorting-associated protein 13A/C
MAKRYINYILKDRLGCYLDGLDNTELSYGLTEATMNMNNVQLRGDAFEKFNLPVDIRFGMIKKLNVKVPWLTLSSCPVEVCLSGMDVILTPKRQENWKFEDIFDEEYLKEQIAAIADRVSTEI